MNHIEVWPIRLRASGAAIRCLRSLLSADEAQRADRFLHAPSAAAFTVSRAALRLLCGRYLGRTPDRIRFGSGPQGKPHLREGLGLTFNLSHSGDLGLFAFTSGCEIGIDVEGLRPLDDAVQISEDFFADEEREALTTLPADCRAEGFLTCWTRKEAFLKATGDGLILPLDAFAVTLAPRERVRLLRVPPQHSLAAWQLRDIPVRRGFVAALAYQGAPRAVEVRPETDIDYLQRGMTCP